MEKLWKSPSFLMCTKSHRLGAVIGSRFSCVDCADLAGRHDLSQAGERPPLVSSLIEIHPERLAFDGPVFSPAPSFGLLGNHPIGV